MEKAKATTFQTWRMPDGREVDPPTLVLEKMTRGDMAPGDARDVLREQWAWPEWRINAAFGLLQP